MRCAPRSRPKAPRPKPLSPTPSRTRADPGSCTTLSARTTHPGISRVRRKEPATMAKLSTDELLDAFKELSLIELSEFVKKFEETFEVTAAAPVAVAAAGPAAGGAGGEA